MVFRKLAQPFCHQRVKYKSAKYIINELPKTFNDQVYPQLPFLIRSKRTKIKTGFDNNPGGQLYSLSFTVSDLVRDERLVLSHNKAVVIRPHVERLIVEAMRHGDRHIATMDLANWWLREKNLVHKLFKVLVPRYANYSSAFTSLHMLGKDYDKHKRTISEIEESPRDCYRNRWGDSVLELRGNNLPPIIRPKLNKSGLLSNMLIDGARESYRFKISSLSSALSSPQSPDQRVVADQQSC